MRRNPPPRPPSSGRPADTVDNAQDGGDASDCGQGTAAAVNAPGHGDDCDGCVPGTAAAVSALAAQAIARVLAGPGGSILCVRCGHVYPSAPVIAGMRATVSLAAIDEHWLTHEAAS